MNTKYISSLLLKSAHLQAVIDTEQKRRKPDPFRIIKLKKLRLVLKDKLHKIVTARKNQSHQPQNLLSA